MAELDPAGPIEIMAHRALWSLAFSALVLTITVKWRSVLAVFRNPRALLVLTTAAALIAFNWVVMLYSVQTNRVSDSSLGYYINPLITVALGVILLRERLHRAQGWAIAIATLAIVAVGVDRGGIPWIAPTLAITFALYSLVKKQIGSSVDALTGFTVETIVLIPPAVAILYLDAQRGTGTWGEFGISHDLWLASSGVWTGGALILFAASAQRLPLYVLGLIQYVTPTMSFILAVTYFGEAMSTGRWVGFGLVWVALVIITGDSLKRARATSGRARDEGRGESLESVPDLPGRNVS